MGRAFRSKTLADHTSLSKETTVDAMGEEKTERLRGSTNSNGSGGKDDHSLMDTDREKSPAPSSSGASSHATLAYVFLFLLVDLLGFTVILPLIPSLLEYYDKHDEASRLRPPCMSECW